MKRLIPVVVCCVLSLGASRNTHNTGLPINPDRSAPDKHLTKHEHALSGAFASKKPMPVTEGFQRDAQGVSEYLQRQSEIQKKKGQLKQLADEISHLNEEAFRLQILSRNPRTPHFENMAQNISRWNGNIFWAPAAKESDINLKFADEVRSVFGPIPPFDVTKLGRFTRTDGSIIETGELFVEVEGNRVELKPNTSKPGRPLEFEHRDMQGNFVKWTTRIERCDKPSLAGGVTPCGTASRISRIVKGNVEWIALARKAKGVTPLEVDEYWTHSNPSFELVGYIGFNRISGEVAFFDGTYEGMKFTWDSPIVPPGGAGYQDEAGRKLASKTYDSTFRINCAECHDNKEPRIITPYIKQARVGYRKREVAEAFSLGSLLPELTRGHKAPYRVIGSAYTEVHKTTIDTLRIVIDPTRNCSTCHGLTNGNTARFASDAVGRLGSLGSDAAIENNFRTDWALRSGNGKIHPWMSLAPTGNDISGEPPPPIMSDDDWAKLSNALLNAESDPRSLKLYTGAPAPESGETDETRLADSAGPESLTFAVVDNREGSIGEMPKEVSVKWQYLNSLGGVPERDDVRFNMAILESDVSSDGARPRPEEYPTIEETKGLAAIEISPGVYTDGRLLILKDISFAGHQKWTDPAPASSPRSYRIDFPASQGKRYLIRIVAKRYSFDQSVDKHSSVDHVLLVDVH